MNAAAEFRYGTETATAAVPISIDEYFNTEYEPDCEYIAGKLEDRNVGKRKHGLTQFL